MALCSIHYKLIFYRILLLVQNCNVKPDIYYPDNPILVFLILYMMHAWFCIHKMVHKLNRVQGQKFVAVFKAKNRGAATSLSVKNRGIVAAEIEKNRDSFAAKIVKIAALSRKIS